MELSTARACCREHLGSEGQVGTGLNTGGKKSSLGYSPMPYSYGFIFFLNC